MRKVILVTGARAPSALHLARIFHSAGHRVILADTLRYPMSWATRMKDAYAQLPSPRQSFSNYCAAVAALVARRLQTLLCRLAKRCFSWRRYVTGEASIFRCSRRISICLRRSTTRLILPRWPRASALIRPGPGGWSPRRSVRAFDGQLKNLS